jgi:hypothetical protein
MGELFLPYSCLILPTQSRADGVSLVWERESNDTEGGKDYVRANFGFTHFS